MDITEPFEIWIDHKNLKIFQRTPQVKQMTSQVVPKITRLQFHFMVYTWKDKHKSGYSIKKRLGRYKKGQQGCLDAQKRIVNKKNNSRDNDVKKKQDG